MTKKRPLTGSEKSRLRPLERRLRQAARHGDLPRAKKLAGEIQAILRHAGDETRLQKAKAWVFEAALEAGELGFAERGFIGIRAKMSPRTRIYLEATAFLAICHLRRRDLTSAKPLMEEAFRRVKNVKTPRRQRQFYRRMVERFDDEWAVAVLSEDSQDGESLDPHRVQDEAGQLVATTTDEEIYLQLGQTLPKVVVDRLLEVYEFSRNQLPKAERLLLPSPESRRKKREVGKTVFGAAKRAVWKALCDPTSDTYKMWFERGLMVALDKKIVGGAVVAALTGIGMGTYAIAIPVTAILIKVGVDVFCETYKPEGLMIGLDE